MGKVEVRGGKEGGREGHAPIFHQLLPSETGFGLGGGLGGGWRLNVCSKDVYEWSSGRSGLERPSSSTGAGCFDPLLRRLSSFFTACSWVDDDDGLRLRLSRERG